MKTRYTSSHTIVATVAFVFCSMSTVTATYADDRARHHDWDQVVEGDGSNIKVSQQEKWGYQSDSASSSSSSAGRTVTDDRSRLTADSVASSEAGAYFDWAHCAVEQLPHGDDPFTQGSWVCAYPPPAPGEDPTPTRIPTTREILLAAATLIHADGAGLRKRPEGVSYTNKYIPTLVNATHPTQTHTITLLGRTITITLNAEEYTWNWGDGTPNTTTTSPGAPWQKGMNPLTDPTLIRHHYTPPQGWRSSLDGPYPTASRTITLTTTWSGTATNPFTGQTQTINGLITTTETTDPFPLDHLIINNTDTWEEKQGH